MKNVICTAFISLLLLSSCTSKQQYVVSSVEGERILVKPTNRPDERMVRLVEGYKTKLDKEMNVVIGESLQDMSFDRPQSLLTNLTSDVMRQLDTKYTGGVPIDLALMNVHGHRAPLAKGNVTVGNIFEIYSFDNELVIVELRGSDLVEVFNSYAKMGGAGVSSNVRLIISKSGNLIDAAVSENLIDNDRVYVIVTLDYLAEGNDGMEALKNAGSVKRTGVILRDYMMDYVKSKTRNGQAVSSKLDGRIIIQ